MKKLLLLCISLLFLQTPIKAISPDEPQQDTTWEKVVYHGALFAFGAVTTAAAGFGALVADKFLYGRVPHSKVFSSMLAIPSLLTGYVGSALVALPIAKVANESAKKKNKSFFNKKTDMKTIFAGAAVGAAFSALCFYGLYQK